MLERCESVFDFRLKGLDLRALPLERLHGLSDVADRLQDFRLCLIGKFLCPVANKGRQALESFFQRFCISARDHHRAISSIVLFHPQLMVFSARFVRHLLADDRAFDSLVRGLRAGFDLSPNELCAALRQAHEARVADHHQARV